LFEYGTWTSRILKDELEEDELEEDLLQQVTATTLEEGLSPPCLDDVADYFSLAEEVAEF
jgi:hypothetical protein